MFCSNCGAKVSSDAHFCGVCGKPLTAEERSMSGGSNVPPANSEPTVFGTLALVFSIVAFVFIGAWVPGLVFSIIGLKVYKNKISSDHSKAKAGLILSIISGSLFILFIRFFLWLIML